MTSVWEISDFSGGETDYYLSSPPNKLRRCENLLLIQTPGGAKPYTRPGCEVDLDRIPAGVQRIGTIVKIDDVLHVQSSAALYASYDGSTWNTISSLAGGNTFNATTADYFTVAPWNHHILWASSAVKYPIKSFVSSTGVVQSKSAGAPKYTNSVTATPAVGAENYLYKFVYLSKYTTKDNITYSDVGTPSSIKSVPNASIAGGIALSFTYFVNGPDDKFPSTGMWIQVYRTTNNGTVFYLVTENFENLIVPFGYTDTMPDSVLTTRPLLYTEGGVQPNDRPPQCSLVHIMGDTGYYAYVKDTTGTLLRYRFMQSIPGDFDAVPATFYGEVDDEIVGLSSTKSNLMLLCRAGNVYRVDGQIDLLGRGEMIPTRISDAATCVSSRGVVQAHDGLFWAGLEGIWYTDGYQVLKLNGDHDETWRSFVTTNGVSDPARQALIVGSYDRRNNRIWWAVKANDASTEPDTAYVLDLNFGIRPQATFTRVTGLSSFAPTYLLFDGDVLYRGGYGYVFTHKKNLYTDIQIDGALVDASLWPRQTIFYDLETIGTNFGSSALRKYVPRMSIVADNDTNTALQIVSNNDDDQTSSDLLQVKQYGMIVWGDDIYWGDSSWSWNGQGLVVAKRRFPAGSLRCTHKSIRFKNAFTTIITSDILGTCSVNASTLQATLGGAFTWPNDIKDWYLSFEADDYQKEYLVTTNNATGLAVTVSFTDPYGTAVDATNSKWELRGYPKGEILNLLSLSVSYETFSPTQTPFRTADQGAVSDT